MKGKKSVLTVISFAPFLYCDYVMSLLVWLNHKRAAWLMAERGAVAVDKQMATNSVEFVAICSVGIVTSGRESCIF